MSDFLSSVDRIKARLKNGQNWVDFHVSNPPSRDWGGRGMLKAQ